MEMLSDRCLPKIEDEMYKNSLKKIEEAVQTIWSGPIIIKDYPDHEISHAERITKYIEKLLSMNEKIHLNEQESYLLRLAACLHDIGMQCDVTRYDNIKKKAEELGATFHINSTLRSPVISILWNKSKLEITTTTYQLHGFYALIRMII